jgi:hypothetical protein
MLLMLLGVSFENVSVNVQNINEQIWLWSTRENYENVSKHPANRGASNPGGQHKPSTT